MVEGIQQNVILAPYTTWKIGGPAEYFFTATTDAEFLRAIEWARLAGHPIHVLGGGSNTLISDRGLRGLVILARNDQLAWEPPAVTASAGVKLGQFIAAALQHGLGGLDWLIGVPGTIGGSIFGNAGSRTEAIGQYLEWVEGVMPNGELRRWSQNECEFSYRQSRFKRQPAILIRARLSLPQVNTDEERKRLAAKAKFKNSAQPTTGSSAGCMFTNPHVDPKHLPTELQPHILPDRTISAWRLIDQIGLRGRTLGGMQISDQHANFLLNRGGGTADQAVQLISLVKRQVSDKLGVQLQEEIRYLGFE